MTPRGIAIHGAGGERRLGKPRGDIGGKNAAACGIDGDGFGTKRHNAFEQLRQCSIDRQQRHQAGACHSPERPPDFLSSRTPEMTMPRSLALAMS